MSQKRTALKPFIPGFDVVLITAINLQNTKDL